MVKKHRNILDGTTSYEYETVDGILVVVTIIMFLVAALVLHNWGII